MAVGISDKERRRVTFVVGETFDDFLFHFEALALFDGDDAVFADFANNISDEFADLWIAGGNGGNLGDFAVVAFDLLGGFFDAFDDFDTGVFNSLAEFHGIDTGSDELVGFSENVVSQNCDSGGAIAGDFVEFFGGGFDELGADSFAEVFVGRTKIDGFSDGHAVMRDGGGTVGFFDDNVLTFGAEGDFDGIVELFGAAEDFVAGFVGIEDFLWHFVIPYLYGREVL